MFTASSKALSVIDGHPTALDASPAITMRQFTQGAIQSTSTLKIKAPACTEPASLGLNLKAATGDTFSSPTTAFDSLGISHVVTFVFTKNAAANQWNYTMNFPKGDLAGVSAPPAGTLTAGTLTVDADGNVTSPASPPWIATKLTSADRERLILEHLPQVRLIARRIHERVPGSVNLDDLISTGTVGLIAAIDRFDPSLNVKLKTYAEYKIRGGILDSLRGLDWAPRQHRRRSKQIEAAIAEVEHRIHRTPTEEEIAAHLGVSVAAYHGWLVELQGLNVGSLETAAPDDDGSRDLLNFISDDKESWPSSLMERSELQRLLAQAIDQMPAMEKTVLSLYYYEELTLREISKIVHLHESRISQLKSQAILRLRAYMEKRWPCPRGV